MELKYPMLEISEEAWQTKKHKDFYIIFNNKTTSIQLSGKDTDKDYWYKTLRFVNPHGDILKVTGFKKLTKKGLMKYMPFITKWEYLFELTEETMSINELRELLINRANEVQNQDLVEHLKTAQSYIELLGDKL